VTALLVVVAAAAVAAVVRPGSHRCATTIRVPTAPSRRSNHRVPLRHQAMPCNLSWQ